MSVPGEGYHGPQYLMTSEQLLDPEVGAVEIGLLVTGAFEAVKARMDEVAVERGIRRPRMIADLISREGKASELGSTGQPYPVAEFEWEIFAADVPEYCGDNVPRVYVVDGSHYAAPI